MDFRLNVKTSLSTVCIRSRLKPPFLVRFSSLFSAPLLFSFRAVFFATAKRRYVKWISKSHTKNIRNVNMWDGLFNVKSSKNHTRTHTRKFQQLHKNVSIQHQKHATLMQRRTPVVSNRTSNRTKKKFDYKLQSAAVRVALYREHGYVSKWRRMSFASLLSKRSTSFSRFSPGEIDLMNNYSSITE